MSCAIGAIVSAAASSPRRSHLVALTVGFSVALAATWGARLPEPAWVGLLSAVAALVWLFQPRYALLASTWGGALGGIWAGLMTVQGVLPWVGVVLAGATVILTVALTRSYPAFAPEALLDEALLAMAALGVGLAALPAILDGWRAAGNLNASTDAAQIAVPTWTATLVIAFTVLGGAYSLWSHRR